MAAGSTPLFATGGTQVVWPAAQLVGFGPRFVALVIDLVLLGIVEGVLEAFHLKGLSALVSAGYFIYLWTATSQTLGMAAMGIKVVRADGLPLTWTNALLRYVGYIVCWITLGIGYLWVLWDPAKQGLHDKIGHTVVIRAA